MIPQQTSLALVNTTNASGLQQRSLLKSFISNYTSETFFSEIISIALYPADFGSGSSLMRKESIIDYIRSFLKDIVQMVQKNQFPNQNQIKKQAGMISSILTVRESAANINYDNIFQYIAPPDLAGKKLINTAIQNKITNLENFKENLNNVITTINLYTEVKSISSNFILYDCLIDSIEQSTAGSIFDSIKAYSDLIISSYNDLSKLQILNKIDKAADYHVLKNKDTTHDLSRILSEYVSTSFNFYKTGYELIDNNIHGLESSSVHIVTAPSNHCKSLFLINLMRNVILNNIDDFEEDSAIVFVTLEDNIPKLTKRIASIFGNCNNDTIGDLYREGSQRIHQLKKTNSDITSLQDNITKIFDGILVKAIDDVTKFKTSIVIKHSSENNFSPGDLSKFVDRLRVTENLNVKLIVMDYIDVARPTIIESGSDEYHNQGKIVHELRQLSRNLEIPILTATQNSRSSENLRGELTNQLIGDSYLKVRYTDFIYMCRKCDFLTFLDNQVAYDVLKDESGAPPSPQDLVAYEALSKVLIPYEIRITKAKEGTAGKSKYMLFCTENLRIYDNVEQYVHDSRQLKINTRNLENEIVQMSATSNAPNFNDVAFLNQDF